MKVEQSAAKAGRQTDRQTDKQQQNKQKNKFTEAKGMKTKLTK